MYFSSLFKSFLIVPKTVGTRFEQSKTFIIHLKKVWMTVQ